MKKSLEELIERANNIKTYLEVSKFELSYYDDGSFIDFRVKAINQLQGLLSLAGFCQLKIFADENEMVIRMFEREDTEIDDV